MYILGINGSPNEKGNTYFLLNEVLKRVTNDDNSTKLYNMQKVLDTVKTPFCHACTKCEGDCYKESMLEELFDEMRKADVILMGSPVYFGGPTAQLKCLFDKGRKIRGEKGLLGKYGAALAVGGSKYGGQETTVRTIHNNMLIMGMTILGDGSSEFGGGHFGISAHRPAMEDEFAKMKIESMAQRILSL